jgi:hypothetical protein
MRLFSFVTPALLIFSAAVVEAQVIAVPNFSFENPSTQPPLAGNGDYFQFNTNNSTFVPNWTFNDVTSVSGTLANRFAGIGNPGTSDGNRVAFFNTGTAAESTATTSSPVTTISSGLDYTLTVALGNTPGTGNYSQPGTFVLSLLANPLAGPAVTAATTTINGDAIPDGTIADYSLTLTALQASAFVGDGLSIQVGNIDSETNGNVAQALFDNVRLDANAAPEPSIFGLIGLGLLALMFVRRFRQLSM